MNIVKMFVKPVNLCECRKLIQSLVKNSNVVSIRLDINKQISYFEIITNDHYIIREYRTGVD